jgi:hypothetical protein
LIRSYQILSACRVEDFALNREAKTFYTLDVIMEKPAFQAGFPMCVPPTNPFPYDNEPYTRSKHRKIP